MDESDSSDTRSTLSSEASVADERLRKTGKRKPHVDQPPVYNIRVKYCSGNVAVGSRSAKVVGYQPKGEENIHSPNKNSTQTLDTPLISTSVPEENRELDLAPEENDPILSGPSKAIVINEGNEAFPWSIESFFQDPDQFIHEMNKTASLCKEQRERFVLLKVLPSLEQSWGKCCSSNEEVYKNLAKISCSVNSGIVVKHALELFLHLICKENVDSSKVSLLVVEAIMRSSIFSADGVLRTHEHSEQNLKLFAYNHILSLILIKQQVQEVELPIVALERDLKKVQEELRRLYDHIKSKKKDRLRYSMELILKAIPYFLQPQGKSIIATKVKGFIEECQEFCGNSTMKTNDLEILRRLKKNKIGEWNYLHYILIFLHGKVHSERPVPQMETERRAMILIRLIVEAYLQSMVQPGPLAFSARSTINADWRFCLLVSFILGDIAKNNVTKELRKEAGACLVNLLKDEKVKKRPECRVLLERICSELLLCPDKETRKFLLDVLFKDQNLEESLSIDQHTEHLSWLYRTQTLEVNRTTVSKNSSCFVNHGMFQKVKVAVKVLYVKKQHLQEDVPNFEAKERLIQEVYNMRRLNASRHPNFPVLLGYDTISLPYHLITAFEKWGNLLQFLRKSRERDPPVQPKQLLKMLIDVSDALLFLNEQGWVHRAIMAENVLVGENFVCKLSGLHSLQQLTNEPSDQAADSVSMDGYCSAETPKFVSTFNDEDLPIRWKAPECLCKHRYSPASDVWAFGVLMYEVLTYGCTPYSEVSNDQEVHLRVVEYKEVVPLEFCFEEEEYELIKQCCEWQPQKRLQISEVNRRLKELFKYAGEKESRLAPPPLETQQIMYASSNQLQCHEIEDLYASISDISEYCRSQSVEEDEDLSEEVKDDLVKKKVQGLTMIWEKLSQQDDKHVKGLLGLNHPNLASFLKVEYLDSHNWMISPEFPNGNLKEYVLDRRCNQTDIVTYLTQVASALHNLHVNHIVHGDLRAEYVSVAAPDKVQVGRLGRSKSLTMSAYEVTSTSCVIGAAMPPDSIRWSAPEVILDGHYTHASDVWAFGILAWELYTSFTAGRDKRQLSVPYHALRNDKILSHMRDGGPLDRPKDCPEWVYILMHQCWAYNSTQRPPFLAIVDCLTSREPMKSWIMQLWLPNHHESEWPDLSIRQAKNASHVLDEEKHPSKQNIERMCSEDYFAQHKYRYSDEVNDSLDGSRPRRETLQEEEIIYSNAYSSRIVKENETREGTSGYLCPAQLDQENHATNDRPVSNIPADSTCSAEDGEFRNKAPEMEDDDCIVHNKPALNVLKARDKKEICQNKAPQIEQRECFIHNKPASNIPHVEDENREYQNMLAFRNIQKGSYLVEDKSQTAPSSRLPTRNRRMAEPGYKVKEKKKMKHENKENVYENTTVALRHVPESEHVYANVQSTVAKTGYSNMEDAREKNEDLPQQEQAQRTFDNHDAGARPNNSALQAFLDCNTEDVVYV